MMKISRLQKIKCFIGRHDETYLGSSLPFYSESLYFCQYCKKFYLYNNRINQGFWTRDMDLFSTELKKHIEENFSELLTNKEIINS